MRSILWIEDEPDAVSSFARDLEASLPARIDRAADVATALDKLDTLPYDIILLDILVPLGALADKFSILETCFDSIHEAGFGLLSIARDERRLLLPNLDAVKAIIVCTNYPTAAFEKMANKEAKTFIFPKASLITDFASLVELISGLCDADGHSIVSLDPPAPPPAITSPVTPGGRKLHEINRTLMSCMSLLDSMTAILTGSPDKVTGVYGPLELRKQIDDSINVIHGLVDQLDAQSLSQRQANSMEELLAETDLLEKEASSFSPARRTILVGRIWGVLRLSERMGSKFETRARYAFSGPIYNLLHVDVDALRARIGSVIREVRGLDTPASGEAEGYQVFDAGRLVQELARTHEPQARERRLEIRVEGSVAGAEIEGDRNGFGRIVDNLIDNAIKYNFQLSSSLAWITVRYRCFEDDFCLEVENWGAKIAEDEHGRLTAYGHRGRHATRLGTGRGLAIVVEEVEKLGGTFEFSSRRNPGWRRRKGGDDEQAHVNVFTVRVPLLKHSGQNRESK